MHQLLFQKYYPSYDTFFFFNFTHLKFSLLLYFPSPFFDDIETSTFLGGVLSNCSLTSAPPNPIAAHL